jgi:hypothetical protein
MSKLILDAGAFVAFERGSRELAHTLAAARSKNVEIVTTSPVVAQVWRGGKQALLARILASTRIEAPDETAARRAGELLAKSRTTDVVDALVVGLVRDGDTVVTSDSDDLRRLLELTKTTAHIVRV